MKILLLVLVASSVYYAVVQQFSLLQWRLFEKKNKGTVKARFWFPITYDHDLFGDKLFPYPLGKKLQGTYHQSTGEYIPPTDAANNYVNLNLLLFPFKLVLIIFFLPSLLVSMATISEPYESEHDRMLRLEKERDELTEEIHKIKQKQIDKIWR